MMHILCLILLSLSLAMCGCSQNAELIKYSEIKHNSDLSLVDDIEGWDIDAENISQITIRCYHNGAIDYVIDDQEDIRLLIGAFNEVQNQDIYWDLTNDDGLYGGPIASIIISFCDDQEIIIPYNPLGIITHNGTNYYTTYQLRYYDVVRELDVKYKMGILDLENDFLYEYRSDGLGVVCHNEVILSSERTINEARAATGNKKLFGNNVTFNDFLEIYSDEIELNDIVETETMRIKVIEIKEDNRITAVAVEFKE